MSLVTTETSRERRFASLAESKDHLWERVVVRDVDFRSPSGVELPAAIHCERPWRGRFEGLQIHGLYAVGIDLHFALYARIDNCSVDNCDTGYFIGDATPVWDDATQSNSASNLARLIACRFVGRKPTDIGFELYGGSNVRYEQCVVEGHECDTGWDLHPRTARTKTTLLDCHLEVEAITAINYDGYNNWLIIDGLELAKKPEVLLDCRGDQGSTIYFDRNNWKSVPKIILGRDTNVELGRNSFTDDEFWASVERV